MTDESYTEIVLSDPLLASNTQELVKDASSGASISSDKTPELQDIITEGNRIYSDLVKHKESIKDDFDKNMRVYTDSLYVNHKSFMQTYPVVVRFMLRGNYHPIPFGKWLKSLAGVVWKGEEDFISHQANYCMYLSRQYNPRGDIKKMQELRKVIYEEMIKERKDFKKEVTDAKNKVEEVEVQNKKNTRESIIAFLQKNKDEIREELSKPNPFPMRVVEDK